MNKTRIPWADYSWNPVSGCTPASEGCTNCYAERMARRFPKIHFCRHEFTGNFSDGTIRGHEEKWSFNKIILHPDRLDDPLRRKKPARIFVCSMSDLFHPDVPDEFILKVWYRMAKSNHTFFVLTKRPERIKPLFSKWINENQCVASLNSAILAGFEWPLPNVMLMTTAENQARADERIPYLMELARLGWKVGVSLEPMLGPMDLNAVMGMHYPFPNGWQKLGWIIVGGESGPGARECREEWVQSVYDQCKAAGVPFFFKAHGDNWITNRSDTFCGGGCFKNEKECIKKCSQWLSRREWPR